MRKNFDSVQTLKLREDCDKFSTSVSYETLVGGTTTIGKEIKQTRRLSKGSADKPLTAVGTLTSLLCNSAKVVEKLFYRHSEPKAKNPKKTGTVMPDLIRHLSRIKKEAAEVAFGAASQAPCLGSRLLSCPRMTMLWILRFANASLRMTILALALLFTLATTAESRADDTTSGTCGDDCTWSFSNGTLKIIGDIQDYGDGVDTPWTKAGLRFNIKTIDASESTGFGTCSFEDLREVTKVIMPKQINGIPDETFRSCDKLENLEFPDGLQYIGFWALSRMDNLKSITIPDSATNIHSSIFEESSNINTIYCKGSISACRNNLAEAGINYLTVLTAPEEQCQNSSNYYYTGTECTNRPENPDDITCVGGYAKLKNNCVDPLKTFAKKHYTPAEANEWLHDGNDNFVIITFKK